MDTVRLISYQHKFISDVFPELVPWKYYSRYLNKTILYSLLSFIKIYKNFLFILIDVQKDLVLGCVIIRYKINIYNLHRDWYIYGVAIKKEYRNRGYGQTLMQQAVKWSKSNSIKEIKLLVELDNIAAINLYKKVGFTTVTSIDIMKLKKIDVPKNYLLMLLEL